MATEVSKEIMGTDVSGTYTIECDEMPGVDCHLTITGDTTIKVNGVSMKTILNLMLHNDNIGGHTITFDLAQLATEGGIQPSFSTTADECNSFIFMGSSGTNQMHIMAQALGVKHA